MEYIISQTFVVLSYVLLGITYFLKNRKLILTLSLSAVLCNGVSYFLLKAWSGLAMTGVAILRSVIFLIQNRKNKSESTKRGRDGCIGLYEDERSATSVCFIEATC